MAAGTAKSHSEEGAPDRVDLLVDKFHFEKFVILQFVVECAKDEVTRADELGISLDGRCVGKEVSGKMLANELVVRLVLVK